MCKTNSSDIYKYISDAVINLVDDYDVLFEDFYNKFEKKYYHICYSYILENSSDNKLIGYTIRQINKFLFKENLSDLVNYILTKNDKSCVDNIVLAIKTISNYKSLSSTSALMYCLNDKNSNYKIRLAAAEALGKIGDKNAFDSLKSIASDEEEKSVYLRESAAYALGILGDNRALDVFESILNTKQMFMDKFSFLKEKIIEAMSKLEISEDKPAYKTLKASLLDTSASVRISAIEAIMNIDGSHSYDLIYDRLINDQDFEVKKNALIALYNISDRKILDEVINGEFSYELKTYAQEMVDEYEG